MSAVDEWLEITIPIKEIVSRLGWWLLAVAVGVFGPTVVFAGASLSVPWPWSAGMLHEAAIGVALLLLAYLVSVPIHEGLHALGMLMTGVHASDITFGARLLHGVVYVHCRAAMRLSAYRVVLLIPVVVTGLGPAIWGILTGNGWVATYAYLMIVSAIGDLEMYWRLRGWPGRTLVRDHPSLLGCEIKLDRDSMPDALRPERDAS